MFRFEKLLWLVACLSLLSCGGGHNAVLPETEVPFKYSSLLKMYEGDGYTRIVIRNPWDSVKALHTYILVPDSVRIKEVYPAGTVIRTPLKKGIVFSSVHTSLFEELGAIDAVVGVCDTEYIHDRALLSRLSEGRISDCGGSMSPDIERIISLRPDALFLSPYQDPTPYVKLTEIGAPIVECADYMESNPLGRAEWVKFYAMLTGREKEGDALFSKVESEYLKLKNKVEGVEKRPQVLTELKQGDTWFMPAKNSTTGIFIEDAGGRLPSIAEDLGGSVAFTPEKVLMSAADADIWLIKYYNDKEITFKWIYEDSPVYRNFDAFKNRNVYVCNTSKLWFYEEVPFHPHWLLADMISILHPEAGVEPYPGKNYYSKPLER